MTAMECQFRAGLLLAPSLLRMYGLRSAAVFLVMILALGRRNLDGARGGDRSGDWRAQRVRGRQRSGDSGVARHAGWHRGDVERGRHFADSNNHVIRRIDAVSNNISTVVGNNRARGGASSGDYGPAT